MSGFWVGFWGGAVRGTVYFLVGCAIWVLLLGQEFGGRALFMFVALLPLYALVCGIDAARAKDP